jgi:hypothetical protein
MSDDCNYDSVDGRYIGSKYGDMRRERAALMKRLCHDSDVTVKPRIREITLQLLNHIAAGTKFHRTNANCPSTK